MALEVPFFIYFCKSKEDVHFRSVKYNKQKKSEIISSIAWKEKIK